MIYISCSQGSIFCYAFSMLWSLEVLSVDMRECVAKRIVELCAQRKIAFRKLATISAVHPSTVISIINGASKNPGVVTIKKLCDGLDISLIEFFDTEDFKNLEQEIK